MAHAACLSGIDIGIERKQHIAVKKSNEPLPLYLKKFTRLRQGVTRYGKAPHKPVLLLTFIELFEKGEITDNCVYISPELVSRLKENFALLVRRAPPLLPHGYKPED